MGLTEEQRRKIEENRKRALALRAAKQTTGGIGGNHNPPPVAVSRGPATPVPKPPTPVKIPAPSVQSSSYTSAQRPQQSIQPPSNPTVSTSNAIQRPTPSGASSNTLGHSAQHVGQNTYKPPSAPTNNFYNSSKQSSSGNSSSYQNKSTVSKPVNSWSNSSDRASSSYGATSTSAAPASRTGGYTSQQAAAMISQSPTKTGGSTTVVKGSCVLKTRTRFEVQVGFSKPLVDLFKTIEKRQYDPQTRRWSFDLASYNDFMRQVNQLPGVKLEPLPSPVQRAFGAYIRGASDGERHIPDADLSKVDKVLVDTLMPFQREGVNFCIWRNGRALIADDMGLGKTLQALCVAVYYKTEWPLLVVVPSSVRFAWREQFIEWVPTLNPSRINVVTTGKMDCTCGMVNILSYDILSRQSKVLMEKGFKVIIMDESHFLKNAKTARTKAAVPLLKQAKRIILLSGTPALSRPSELFSQINAVEPKVFSKFHDFGLRYCEGKQMQWGWDFSGSNNLEELQVILEEGVMIRRLKKDVLSQLPVKQRHMVVLDPGSVKIDKTMKVSHKMVDNLKGMERRGALLNYFHSTCTAKLPAASEYIMDLLEADHKFLVFGHHQEMLDSLEETIFKKHGNIMIRIDGRTASETRNIVVEKFQTDSKIRVALLSITAANAGIDLTAASMVIFAELFWNPGILMQAEDRVHRIGQQDCVTVRYLVAAGTADDYIWPLVQKKLDVLGKAGLSKDNFNDAESEDYYSKASKLDPAQSSIMKYFEESFIEDTDMVAAAEAMDCTPPGQDAALPLTPPKRNREYAVPYTKSPFRSPPKSRDKTPTKQTSLLTYFQSSPPKRKAPSLTPSPEMDINDNDKAQAQELLSDLPDDLWDDLDDDPSAPWPKRPKLL